MAAAALTAAGLVVIRGGGNVAAAVGSLTSTSSVALRRRRPEVAVAAAVGGALVLAHAAGHVDLTVEAVAIALCFYLLGTRSARLRRSVPASALLACWLAAAAVVGRETGAGSFAAVGATWATTGLLPLLLGVVVERHRWRAVELEHLTAELAAEEELRATLAAEEERTRIARDLHDVVAHCVSVMVIQAGAAGRILSSDVAGALAALEAVGESGREALRDLRRVVGVIRHEETEAAEPRLSQLHALVDRARRAGVHVELSVLPTLQLPLAIEATAYRLVQEALTNTIKHAPSTSAGVAVQREGSTVRITVVDEGSRLRPAAGNTPGSGRGLIGMRERVAAHGGELAAGRRADGGFEVRASIPLPPGAVAYPRRTSVARSRFTASADAVIATVALVGMEMEVFFSVHRTGSTVLNAVVVAAMAAAAIGRRRHPVIFLVVVGCLAAVLGGGLTSLDYATFTGTYALTLPLWTVATCTGSRTAIAALSSLLVVATAATALVDGGQIPHLLGAALVGSVVWAAGRALRAHRRTTAELQTRARALENRREDRMQVATATENTRIARGLQTGVAHALAEIVVETEAAQRLVASGDPKGIDAIAEIEAAARRALVDMRTTLGVLRRAADIDAHSRRVPGSPPPITEPEVADPAVEPMVAVR